VYARVREAMLSDAEENLDLQEADELQMKDRSPFQTGCWNCGVVDHGYRLCESTDR